MNILLVAPPLKIKMDLLYKFVYYRTLALEQVAAITPEQHKVEIVEENFQTINFEKDYDLVGISCLTCNAIRGYEIADEFRKRGKTVVLGGHHPTALPDEAKQHADSVVLGEAEITWPQLLKDLQNKELKPFYRSDELVDSELIPPAKRSNEIKTTVASIQATRGCPNRCKFCAMHNVEGGVYRPRPVEHVIEEIKSIKCKNLFFVDSSLTINPNYSKELFKEMIGLNKKFECYGNLNVLARDEELLELAYKAGCVTWSVGFESISQESINEIGKKTNKIEDYYKVVKNIHDHGMMVVGLFVFGFDNDDPSVFKNTVKTVNDLGIDFANFSILTPYPGTPLFNELIAEDRITCYDWSHYNEASVNFRPKQMTEMELYNGVRRAAKEFWSFGNSFRRCIGDDNLDFSLFNTRLIRNLILARLFYKEQFNF